MLTFNPGPSHMTEKTMQYIHEIVDSGVLSWSHRSQDFTNLSKKAITLLKQKLHIPDDYIVFYQPSATAAMETILRNLVKKESFHFVHGAFSKRFYQTAQEIGINANLLDSPWRMPVPYDTAEIKDAELITITHNETSTGLIWPWEAIKNVRTKYPNKILAIDVTSSLGAMKMPWDIADAWCCSVQKCLGMPAGMGLIILNKKVLENNLSEGIASWQSFPEMLKKMEKFQTVETPNVFMIALLSRQLEDWDLEIVERDLYHKSKMLYEADVPWHPFIEDSAWASPTVLNLKVDNPDLWHERASHHNVVLGKGYGKLKNSCIRLANFPAITMEDVQNFLQQIQH
jgi:phosphoserine aminotransferase